ncbi:hypothetical protein CLAFUW4_03058 [Fulvia fulva]|uniref:Uncharacterized protein n=1 Tax=Passalora fulva TaxID=5499 RepID=A0A9Q8LAW4_PASFU|nr:uncharacterized protein CLAFUR5_03042 [Fulvia fulva]KAK4630919.1 hypothetical protein CLAFUR4_03051 [Fulvia fulva]KAK4632543.1 hypothetical protein CLAFUR0_03054 [Fulvia fulva]UJO14007.1 hypothetical protein CLAFUR5_03042 [Fulvia fulva]WPV11548.1 hypothetical protein CLAFUW4_03058 [Fulvia fulva]WPV26212.1 hypothetical protein CLAFUW7_03055 [Fulvia fulva]
MRAGWPRLTFSIPPVFIVFEASSHWNQAAPISSSHRQQDRRFKMTYHGRHAPGVRHTYDHKHHSRRSSVLNATRKTMSSDEIRGALNSSKLALHAPHGQPLTVAYINGKLDVKNG